MITLMKKAVNWFLLLILDIYGRYFGGNKKFLPTLEDIENKDLKELANKLNGDSNKETLTNILEWQERNVLGWNDRMYMFYILHSLLVLYILLVLSSYFLPINPFIKILFILILVLMVLVNFTISYYLPLIGFILVLFSWVFMVNPMVAQNMLPIHFFVLLSILFGAFIGLILYLLLKYREIKNQISEFKIRDTFEPSLPVNKILKYKLAICRDYAKLTATLLFKFMNSEVYFFTIPGHVAAAVKIKNEYYILDQKLPVLTKDGWLKRWNRKDAIVYASELVRNLKGESIKVNFKKHEKVRLSDFSEDKDIDKIELDNVSKLLGIKQISQKEKPDFKISLKDYAIYYEVDDIIKYSLMKAIKNKLENEFCGNVDKISKVELNQSENKNDLNLSVYLQQ